MKQFNSSDISDEDMDIALVDVLECSILDGVSTIPNHSYDMKNDDGHSSLAFSKEWTIWVSDSKGLMQMDKMERYVPQASEKLLYVSVMESRVLLIAYKEQDSIDIQHNKCRELLWKAKRKACML